MPIVFTGSLCARRGCGRPHGKDGLCNRCWRLAKLVGKSPRLFAYEPVEGYRDERDSVALPWELWERAARERGVPLADLLAESPDELGAA